MIYLPKIAQPALRHTKREDVDQYAMRMQKAIDEDLEKYYQVRELYRTKDELDAVRRDIEGYAQLLGASRDLNLWPRNGSSCTLYSRCEYLDVCCGVARLDDDGIFRDREK